MKVFKKITDIQAWLKNKKNRNVTIGLVPTMGALHDGHLKLLEICKSKCDVAVASVFVNPTQFNDKKDLDKYPRTIEKDITALSQAGCDVLFYPVVEEMYPPEEITRFYDLGQLEHLFEGAYRPGHFQGVCQVVDKLFTIVKPDQVFFGQKDYQQCMVIQKMIELTPAFSPITMNIIPTMREENGLAMSSRNMRLSEEDKKKATTIYQTLLFMKQNLRPGLNNVLMEQAISRLQQNGFKTDYVGIADAETLQPIVEWNGKKPLVALIAAYLGAVRLIDNLVIT